MTATNESLRAVLKKLELEAERRLLDYQSPHWAAGLELWPRDVDREELKPRRLAVFPGELTANTEAVSQ